MDTVELSEHQQTTDTQFRSSSGINSCFATKSIVIGICIRITFIEKFDMASERIERTRINIFERRTGS